MPMSEVTLAGEPLLGRSGHEAGRALLAKAYRERTGEPCPEVHIAPGGKPYFPGSPVHFSITHTKGHVFCALSDCPIGIDAEELDRNIRLELAEKILSPAERARFEAAPDQRQALLRLWVLKEADAKCSGKGLQGYPSHTDFDPDDLRIQEVQGCYVAIITQER